MSKFYKEVATPESGGRQTVSPSGPTVDANARQEATNKSKGLGGAIQDLLGATVQGARAVGVSQEVDTQVMENQNGNQADVDAYSIGSFAQQDLQRHADERGVEVYNMSPEEIDGVMASTMGKYIDDKGLSKKEYLPIIKSRLAERLRTFTEKQAKANEKTKKEVGYKNMTSIVGEQFLDVPTDAVPEFVKSMQERLDSTVGYDPTTGKANEILDTHDNAKLRMLESFVKAGVKSRDPILMDKLLNKDMKEFFKSVPDYDNAVNVIRQQVQSTINKFKQVSFDTVEEEAYSGIDAGAFKTQDDLDAFFKQKEDSFKNLDGKDRSDAPESKKMFKLKADLTKAMDEEIRFQDLYKSVKSGDFSSVERSAMTEKQKDSFRAKYFSVETGITDMTSDGIMTALTSGSVDNEFKSFLETGAPLPKAFSLAFDEKPIAVGNESLQDAQEKQVNAYMQANALSQDTGNSITGNLKASSVTRILHTANTLNSLKEGVITKKEAQDIITTFGNDLKKNVNSRGVYTSQAAEESMTEEREKQISDFSTDAPWTTDDNASPEYIKADIQNNYNLMIDAGHEPDEAWDRAQEMFETSHRRFENPDGTEGISPREFKNFSVEDMVNVAKSLPVIRNIEKARGSFDSLFSIEGSLSINPVRNYKQSKLVEVSYNGRPIAGTQMSADQMNSNINNYKASSRTKVEETFKVERTKKKSFDDLMKETSKKKTSNNK